jgi:antitoxin (DNA-binding transcriptional repressor) of toxin-antitoxin stability system
MTNQLVTWGGPVERKTYTLAQAKAHLSELTELAASGVHVIITKRGKPVAEVSKPERPRKPVDLAALRRLTAEIPPQEENAQDFMRRARDDSRY